jgi:hypothetical protein
MIPTRGVELPGGSGIRLWIGVQPGQSRPTLWLTDPRHGNVPVTLASFHGEHHAETAWAMIDGWTDVIAAIDFARRSIAFDVLPSNLATGDRPHDPTSN